MLQIFLVGNIHFIELPFGSRTAVLNVSAKNAHLYVRSQSHAARTCCCVCIGCRFLCRGKVKFQKLFERFLRVPASSPPMGTASLPEQAVPRCPWAVCDTAACRGRGTLPSVHTCPLSHLQLVQQFIAFRATLS